MFGAQEMTEPTQRGKGQWDVSSELSNKSTSLETGSSGRGRGSTQDEAAKAGQMPESREW